ncbi:hypothetical protein CR513_44744, partial [Mucuna pruriens]
MTLYWVEGRSKVYLEPIIKNTSDPILKPKPVKSSFESNQSAKAKAARGYNTKVFPRKLKKQDLVLKRVLRDNTNNKLTLNWEGPYRIIEEVGKGAFQLEHLDGRKVLCTWNMTSLRIYYS